MFGVLNRRQAQSSFYDINYEREIVEYIYLNSDYFLHLRHSPIFTLAPLIIFHLAVLAQESLMQLIGYVSPVTNLLPALTHSLANSLFYTKIK